MASFKFVAFCAILATCATADEISDNVMIFQEEGDFRCSSDWDRRCGDNITHPISKPNISMCSWVQCANRSEVIRRGQLCDGTFDCSDLSDECLCSQKNLKNKKTYKICLEIYKDASSNLCKPLLSAPRNVTVSQICDGVDDCLNKEDEKFCGYNCRKRDIVKDDIFHSCTRSGKKVNLNWRHKHDGTRDCDDYSDEWNNNFTFCPTEYNLPHECKFRQKRSRCVGPLRPTSDQIYYASPERLNDSVFFMTMTWVLGSVAFVGNLIIIIQNGGVLFNRRFWNKSGNKRKILDPAFGSTNGINSKKDKMKRINIIMVLSLCFSDMLTGLQVFGMAVTATIHKNDYWKYDVAWLSSNLCIANGFIGMMATEASAFTIFIIASVRLYTVCFPYSANDRLKIRYVVAAIAMAWILSIIFAAVPLLWVGSVMEKSFIYSAAVSPVAHLEANIVERNTLENMARKLGLLYKNKLNSSYTDFIECDKLHEKRWHELEEFMSSISQSEPWVYFGYYTQSSSCLPPVIVTVNEPGWIYSLSILIIDFVAYIFVMVAYIIVCKKTTTDGCFATKRKQKGNGNYTTAGGERQHRKSVASILENKNKRNRSNSRSEEDQDMQKRIFILVATDFACWVPICMLTFINVFDSETVIRNQTTFIISIMMIQINSVINPIVYSKQARKTIKNAIFNILVKIASLLDRICLTKKIDVEENGTAINNSPASSIETKNMSTSVTGLNCTSTV